MSLPSIMIPYHHRPPPLFCPCIRIRINPVCIEMNAAIYTNPHLLIHLSVVLGVVYVSNKQKSRTQTQYKGKWVVSELCSRQRRPLLPIVSYTLSRCAVFVLFALFVVSKMIYQIGLSVQGKLINTVRCRYKNIGLHQGPMYVQELVAHTS